MSDLTHAQTQEWFNEDLQQPKATRWQVWVIVLTLAVAFSLNLYASQWRQQAKPHTAQNVAAVSSIEK